MRQSMAYEVASSTSTPLQDQDQSQTPPPAPSLLLSNHNLKKLNALNPGMDPLTPSSSSEPEERKCLSAGSSAGENAAFKHVIGDPPPKDANFIEQRMTLNGLHFDDYAAYDAHPLLKAEVQGIISARSLRDPDSRSEQRYRSVLRDTSIQNEATFLQNAWPIIMQDGYWTKAEEGTDDHIFQDFRLDLGVIQTMHMEFRRTLLPNRHRDPDFEAYLADALKKGDGKKKSKPNYVLGIDSHKISQYLQEPVPPSVHQLLNVSPTAFLPFLLVEGKSHSGSEQMAILQARRAGSTLVNADRLITDILHLDTDQSIFGGNSTGVRSPDSLSIATSYGGVTDNGQGDTRGTIETKNPTPAASKTANEQEIISREADMYSFIFSATIVPASVTFYVHWHEQITYQSGATDTFYHMNTVFSQSNRDPKHALLNIQRVLHNIIRWGSGDRLKSHLRLFDAIPKYANECYRGQ